MKSRILIIFARNHLNLKKEKFRRFPAPWRPFCSNASTLYLTDRCDTYDGCDNFKWKHFCKKEMFADACQYGSLWSVRMSCQQIGADCFNQNAKWLFETTLQPPFHLSNAFQQCLSVGFYRTQVSLDFFRFSCLDHSSLRKLQAWFL